MKKNYVIVSMIIIVAVIIGLITYSCFSSVNKTNSEEETDTIAISDGIDDIDDIYDDSSAVDSVCIIDEVDELEIPTNNPDNEEY